MMDELAKKALHELEWKIKQQANELENEAGQAYAWPEPKVYYDKEKLVVDPKVGQILIEVYEDYIMVRFKDEVMKRIYQMIAKPSRIGTYGTEGGVCVDYNFTTHWLDETGILIGTLLYYARITYLIWSEFLRDPQRVAELMVSSDIAKKLVRDK